MLLLINVLLKWIYKNVYIFYRHSLSNCSMVIEDIYVTNLIMKKSKICKTGKLELIGEAV